MRGRRNVWTIALLMMMAAMVFVVACSADDGADPGVETDPGLGNGGMSDPGAETPGGGDDDGDDGARDDEPAADQDDDDDGALLEAPDQENQDELDSVTGAEDDGSLEEE